MRPRFFVDVPAVDAGSVQPGLVVELSDGDSRHARTVLRAAPGEPCEFVFSRPALVADAVFQEVGRRVSARITAIRALPAQRVRLLLAQALPQPRKVDEVIEKGTEVGIDSFLIVPAAGSPPVPSEKLEGRLGRWRTIAGEAAKQSRQPAVPQVRTVASVEAALGLIRAEAWRSLVLTPDAETHLGHALVAGVPAAGGAGSPGGAGSSGGAGTASVVGGVGAAGGASEGGAAGAAGAASEVGPLGPSGCWAVWVGPEGGWSGEELERLQAGGAILAGLGSRVLRTETAGPVAGALARYVLSDW